MEIPEPVEINGGLDCRLFRNPTEDYLSVGVFLVGIVSGLHRLSFISIFYSRNCFGLGMGGRPDSFLRGYSNVLPGDSGRILMEEFRRNEDASALFHRKHN